MTETFASHEQDSYPNRQRQQDLIDSSPWLKNALTEVQFSRNNRSEKDNQAGLGELALDAGYNALYYGGQAWVRSLGQIADSATSSGTAISDFVTVLPKPEEASYRSNRWYAQQLGSGLGFAVPFAMTHGALKLSGLSLAARAESSLASTGRLFSSANGVRIADGAITGFAADFALRPVEQYEGNAWLARTKNGITGAAVMTTMTAGSLGLRQMTRPITTALAGTADGLVAKTGRIIHDTTVGAASGVPGGAVSAEVHARVFEGRGATLEELNRSMYTFAWTGGALSAMGTMGRDQRSLEISPSRENSLSRQHKQEGFLSSAVDKLTDYRYRAQWAIRDGHTEARRATYALLNKYDLRHPIQRVREALATPEAPPPRPTLTAENNPIGQFERALPEFFKSIEAKERLMESNPDRRQQYEIFKEMGEVRAQFATQLLKLWNGTPQQPGIKSFTDAELAAHGSSTERIAEIRKAFELPAKAERYSDVGPLTEALIKLNPAEVEASWKHVDLLGEIEIARERFYGYSHDAMSRTMGMPRELAVKDHEPATPVDWMPNRRVAETADLYHGTVSGSLPSILKEGTMLPAQELRLRGIQQKTGESALEEFPRRSISMTRDFNEAYAYHRHSPTFLTGFPVVFGISRDVTARSRVAGFMERGELLIDKLDVGKTIATKLGIKGQDITHIFVPDAEISTVQRQLRAYRIEGVSVVGFNNLKSPQWILIRDQELKRSLDGDRETAYAH